MSFNTVSQTPIPTSLKHHWASWRAASRHPVARNAGWLWLVQLGTYCVPLALLPYLARVLHAEMFGLVGFCQSFSLWVGLLVEFGFTYSATRDIAMHRHDRERTSQIAAGVFGAKVVLSAVASGIALGLGPLNATLRQHPRYLLLAWAVAVLQGFSPLWYFQGTERLFVPALVDVSGKLLLLGGVLALVHTPDDAWKVLAIQAVAIAAGNVGSTWLLIREVSLRFPRLSDVASALSRGLSMFTFRGAVSLYTTANAFLLGIRAPIHEVALFAAGERIAKAAGGLLSPLSQAAFPRISYLVATDRPRALRLVRMSLFGMLAGGSLLGSALWLSADRVAGIVLGQGYEGAAAVIRVLSLLIPTVAVSNVLGVLWMLPNRLDKAFNSIIIAAGIVNLTLAYLLSRPFGALGMAWAVVVSELVVTVAMIVALGMRRRHVVGGRGVQ